MAEVKPEKKKFNIKDVFAWRKRMVRPPHVTWLSGKETKSQSIAVICITAISAVILAGFDALLSLLFRIL